MNLTFDELRTACINRRSDYKNEKGELLPLWSPPEWGNATAGEFGELLVEMGRYLQLFDSVKKMQHDGNSAILIKIKKKKIANNIIYLVLLADSLGIDTGEAVREKFNEVSNRVDSKVFL